MTILTHPVAVDPLIAEAKQRARRRRFAGVVAVLVVAGALGYALLPSTSPTMEHGRQGTRSTSPVNPNVYVDRKELLWRSYLGTPRAPSNLAEARRVRQRAVQVIEETGAKPIRMETWRSLSAAAIDVVAVTRMNRAEYLLHRGPILMSKFPFPGFFRIVGPGGYTIFEYGRVGTEEVAGAPYALVNCDPLVGAGVDFAPPCPAH